MRAQKNDVKKDGNGYAPSIVPYRELSADVVRHEVFFGTANRRLSKEWGLWVELTPATHAKVHESAAADLWLKRLAQKAFEDKHSREMFIEIFGANYL